MVAYDCQKNFSNITFTPVPAKYKMKISNCKLKYIIHNKMETSINLCPDFGSNNIHTPPKKRLKKSTDSSPPKKEEKIHFFFFLSRIEHSFLIELISK